MSNSKKKKETKPKDTLTVKKTYKIYHVSSDGLLKEPKGGYSRDCGIYEDFHSLEEATKFMLKNWEEYGFDNTNYIIVANVNIQKQTTY